MREVRRSDAFVARAKDLFPPGGSATGQPSFELFAQGPLRAAEIAFGHAWEQQREAIEGIGIRFVMTHGVPIFPAMVFYAALSTPGDVVELVDVVIDEDYFEMLDQDPPDD